MVNSAASPPMPTLKKDSGFSLIELIVSMAILALIFGIMFQVLTRHKLMSAKTEIYTKAVFLGNELMQEILSKNYDENPTSPWTSTDSLGLDTYDANYDDIDDYAGYSNSSIPDFPGFTETIRVFYVWPNSSLDDSSYTRTDIKKIIVTVTHSEINPVILRTIMSSHY